MKAMPRSADKAENSGTVKVKCPFKAKMLFQRSAALLLSSTMLVSLPITANAATITDDGDYEILFKNNWVGGTIDGLPDSKHVSFNFDSDNEVVNLSDLVGNDVKYKYYAFEGWKNDDGDVITTITKDDFDGGNYITLDAQFDNNRPQDTDTWYIELDFGSAGYTDEYELDNYGNVCLEFPKSRFSWVDLPTPEVYDENTEFVGWVEDAWSYNGGNYEAKKIYYDVTKEDMEAEWCDVLMLSALYKVKAGPDDTSYTFTLDANGGTIDGKTAQTYINPEYDRYGIQDISNFIPVNSDSSLVFAGWNTKKDGSGFIINSTGFRDEQPIDAANPGLADIFQTYGDDSGNVTLYAVWRKEIKVSPLTNSYTDKAVAEKLTSMLTAGDSVWEELDETENASIIKRAFLNGKKLSAGLVIEKDTSDEAKRNIDECKDSFSYEHYTFSDEAFKVYVPVMANGQEICRMKNIITVLDEAEFELPEGLFNGAANDTKVAKLFLISHDERGSLAAKRFGGKVDGNTLYADMSYEMYSGSWFDDCDQETAVLVGKTEMNILPYSDSENDKDVAYSVTEGLTKYRNNKSNYSWKGEKILAEYDKVLEAYESGKEIKARFVMKKITPTESQKANILNHLDNSDYKDFTPMVYYRIQQYIYADGVFLTTFSDSYGGVEINTVVSEIKSLPAETDPRHSREFAFVGTIKESDDYWRVTSSDATVRENGRVSAYYYASECSIYAFGYIMGGKYHVNFDAWDALEIDGKPYVGTLKYRFNFLSDDEELDIKDFFGINEVKNAVQPYYTFKYWATNDWDFETGQYLNTPVYKVTKDMFSYEGEVLYLRPEFDETIPKGSGTYYIRVCTRGGSIENLPTLNGKVKWSDKIDVAGYGFYYYIGTVKSSDLTSLTIPDPTPAEGQKFLGWNSKFDAESGTVKSHGAVITASDFKENDVCELTADYLAPEKEGEEHRIMAFLNGNGGTIDGKETAWYHSASGSSAGTYSMNLIVPVRSGYKFTGWNTKADGSGYEVDDAGAASMSIFSPYHEPRLSDDNYNVTLYAQWESAGPVVEIVALNKTAATLQINGSLTLTATVSPSDAVDKTITWTSSNKKVAEVSATGKVKAIANGKATITATAASGVSAKCTIVVNTLLNNSSVSAEKAAPGQNVTITGAAEGGTAPYKYAYYFRRVGNTSWKTIGTEFGTATKATLTPTAEAEYEVKVVVKDSKDKTAEKIMKVTAENANTLKNTSVINSDTVQVGDTVRMAASANGGTAPYTYAYYYKRSTNTTWKLLGDKFGTNSSTGFTPTAEASYDIKIIVKDSTGATAEKTFTVNAVKELPLTNVSAINTLKVKVGNAVKLTGKAVGGTSPYTYAFYFKRSANANWKTIGTAFTSTATAKIKPTAAADFDFKVVVMDSTGVKATKQFKVTAVD